MDDSFKDYLVNTLSGLSSDIKRLSSKQEKQNETLLRNTITVEEHHKRSLNLEKKMDSLEFQVKQDLRSIENEIEPIRLHIKGIGFLVKLIRYMGYIAGALLSIFGLIKLVFSLKG